MKTTTQKIENIQAQIQQLENEKKRLTQQQKEIDRKARTKRLIERGAILESMISDAETFTNEQIKLFLEKIIRGETARKILDSVISQLTVPDESRPLGEQEKNWAVPIGKSSSVESGKG